MSSNCRKCGEKLGVYEYNLINNEVVCDYCAEGRIRSKNPLPEDSCWKVVEGFDQLKSAEGVPSNLPKFLFLLTLIATVLFMIHFLQVDRLTIDVIYVPFCAFLTYTIFLRNQGRENYKIHEHNLIITSASDQSERIVDLRKIERYTDFRSRNEYELTLFVNSGEIFTISAYYMKNFTEIFTCIKQNLDTINSGKYFTKESKSSGMTLTFVDPEKAALEK